MAVQWQQGLFRKLLVAVLRCDATSDILEEAAHSNSKLL